MSTLRAFRFVIPLLGGVLCGGASAATVYTWTDAQGVRHFSQYPPADADQPAATLTLDAAPDAAPAADRLQTIRDVARELEQSRQQREQQRAKPVPPPPAPAPPPPRAEPPVLVVPYPGLPRYPGAAPYPPPYPYPYPPHAPRDQTPRPPHGGASPSEPGPEPAPEPPPEPAPGTRVRP